MKLCHNNHVIRTWCCWEISLIESKLWMLYYFFNFWECLFFLFITQTLYRDFLKLKNSRKCNICNEPKSFSKSPYLRIRKFLKNLCSSKYCSVKYHPHIKWKLYLIYNWLIIKFWDLVWKILKHFDRILWDICLKV